MVQAYHHRQIYRFFFPYKKNRLSCLLCLKNNEWVNEMKPFAKKVLHVKGDPKESLLNAALKQQLAIPYGCKNGGCGMCKVKVEKGVYHLGLCSKKALCDNEIKQGYVLACRTFPKGDTMVSLC